jgi:hypothetical protein
MQIIHKIADIIIYKIKNELYRMVINNKNPIFWTTFPWENIDIIKSKDNDNKVTITFRAASLQTLKEFVAKKEKQISYDDALQLFMNIKNQLETLEKQNKSIVTFDFEDIIVINDILFFYINQDKVVDKNNKGKLEIIQPIKKNHFCAPEICKASLPAYISPKASFYSIAALITVCLTNDYQDDYVKALESIWQTPLYWALMRCLCHNPKDRFLLMI